jgi:hypothetical protein
VKRVWCAVSHELILTCRLFRLTDKGRAFYLYKTDIPFLIVSLLLTIVSIWVLARDFDKTIKWVWFFPLLFIVQIVYIFFRPVPKFQVGMTAKRWDAISKENGPFQYRTDGFTLYTETGNFNVKWTEIKQIVAYRNEYFSHDEIGLEVYAEHQIQFSVLELTPGVHDILRKGQRELKAIRQ